MPESVWKIDPGRCCQHSTNETFRDSKKRKCAIWKKDWIYGSEQEPLMRLRVRPILVLVQKSSLKGEVAMRQELISRSLITGIFLFLVGIAVPANAMPNFARKYGVPCGTCHTTIPRLNETGYKFRAAGFRLLAEIGKSEDKKFELGDYFAARLQARL